MMFFYFSGEEHSIGKYFLGATGSTCCSPPPLMPSKRMTDKNQHTHGVTSVLCKFAMLDLCLVGHVISSSGLHCYTYVWIIKLCLFLVFIIIPTSVIVTSGFLQS